MDAAQAKGLELCKREVQMPNGPIYSIGDYGIDVLLHSDVVAKLQVSVIAAK